MSNATYIDQNFSTTKHLTQDEPIIVNTPEDTFKTVLFLSENPERKEERGLRTKGYFKKSYENKPLISIVTVVFNGEKYLEQTIQSVLSQHYDNVEYIIIDGGSTDRTLEILKTYENQIDYWVSEKDEGIYDAMNKGITLCTGIIIGIINADDMMYKKTLTEVAKTMHNEALAYTYGSVHFMNEEGVVEGEMVSLPAEEMQSKKLIDIPFPHPSLFVKNKLYKEIGLFNTKFKLSADYDFSLRILETDCQGFNLGMVTGKFRSGGASGGMATFLDTKDVLLSHHAPKIVVYKHMIISIVKLLLLKYFPGLSLTLRQKFRQKSRHKIVSDTSLCTDKETT